MQKVKFFSATREYSAVNGLGDLCSELATRVNDYLANADVDVLDFDLAASYSENRAAGRYVTLSCVLSVSWTPTEGSSRVPAKRSYRFLVTQNTSEDISLPAVWKEAERLIPRVSAVRLFKFVGVIGAFKTE